MTARDLIRLAERDGWSVSVTGGGHLRLDHPDATGPVFTASTPSDHRALRNAVATMRRALPREPKAPPVVERKRPKRTPKPKPHRQQVNQVIDMYAPPEPWGVGGSAPRRPRAPLPGAPTLRMSRWP